MKPLGVDTFDELVVSDDHVGPPTFVICGRSYFTNSVDPQFEILYLAPRQHSGSRFQISFSGECVTAPFHGGRRAKWIDKISNDIQLDARAPWLDLRPLLVENWSHALNSGVPFALMVRDRVREAGGKDLSLVLPSKVSGKVASLFRYLQFNVLETNRRCTGRFVTHGEDRSVIIHLMKKWIAPHLDLIRSIAATARDRQFDKIFIDRRRGRHLLNGDDVRVVLTRRGFSVVYAEDLSLEEQIALFIRAKEIVAIHGAGLAPLLFRTEEDGPLRIVELLSPGHVTLCFRACVVGLPVDYRFVRGNPTAKMCSEAYQVGQKHLNFMRRHYLSPFEVDLGALELALCPDGIDKIVSQRLFLEEIVGKPDHQDL